MSGSIADLGEFGLIERLLAGMSPGEGVLVGPGDDAAVLARPEGSVLATADLLAEGSHFDLAYSSPADVGFKALAVNVSDIAAMAGRPRYAMISLGAPASTPTAVVQQLYEGFAAASEDFGVALIGGDTVATDALIVSVAVLGEAGLDGVVRRDGAQPGDALCVTGTLGGAAAGLALFRGGKDRRARALREEFPSLALAHRRARARVREGIAAAAAGARAMIDVSDGLAADVAHLCRASRVGVRIEGPAVPPAPGVAEVEDWLGGPSRPPSDVHVLAIRGGDDYELAMAVPPDRVDALAAAIAPTRLTAIGVFTDGDAVEVTGLPEAEFSALGWDHFRGAG